MHPNDHAPFTPETLLKRLDALGIDCPTVSHPPLRTVADSRAHREVFEGAYTKNLFLRNKKGRMWLVTLLEHREVELKALARAVGAGNFSFASEERLGRYLGVKPGAVSPLALINDQGGEVIFVLDRGVVEFDRVHLHPLDNTRTSTLLTKDLLKFLEETGHVPELLALD